MLNRNRSEFVFSVQFLLPAIFLVAFINFYPFIFGLVYSFKNATLFDAGAFIGLDNYASLFKMSRFWHSLGFSLLFAFFSVLGSYVLGFAFAIILNKDIIGRGFLRVALIVPWVIPSVVSMAGWRWMIGDQNAMLNVFLGYLGIDPILFLSDPKWATFSVIVVKIWREFPFLMISLLAGLQTIHPELYEAAHMDGAGKWRSFRSITFPLMKTVSVICWILMAIWCFNDFDTIFLLTQGGPVNATENLILLAYKYSFTKNSLGIGSTIAIASLMILMTLAALLLRSMKREAS